jgi:hypothetical protein
MNKESQVFSVLWVLFFFATCSFPIMAGVMLFAMLAVCRLSRTHIQSLPSEKNQNS